MSAVQSLNFVKSPFFVENDTKETIYLVITAVAVISICALATALLSQLGILTGINSIAKFSLYGVGGGLALTVIIPTVLINLKPTFNFSLKEEELKEQLDKLCETLCEGSEDLLPVVQQCAAAIPFDKLKEVTNVEDAVQLVESMLLEAQTFSELRDSTSPSLRSKLPTIKNTLINVIDSTLGAFGVADFFKPAESAIHADFKFQKIMMLISLFTLLTSTLLPLLGVTTGASIVGASMLGICILSVIWPHVRPAMNRLQNAENWTQMIREGKMWSAPIRQEVIEKLAKAIKSNQPVILVGASGVGKTQTAQALAYALAMDEHHHLQDRIVFYSNTADLVADVEMFSGKNMALKKMEEAFEPSPQTYISVLDEIAVAFQEHDNNPFADKTKLFIDYKRNHKGGLIVMTTAEEYIKYILIDHPAADRRFKVIHIDNTGPKETEDVIIQDLVRELPDFILEEDVLAYIVKKTEGKPQPLTCREMISQWISEVNEVRSTEPELQLIAKKSEQRSAGLRGIIGKRKNPNETVIVKNDIAKREQKVKENKKKAELLDKARKQLIGLRTEKYVAILNNQPAQFMFIENFAEPALVKYIGKFSKEIGIDIVLTKAKVDDLLAKEEERNVQRKEAIEQAQKRSDQRKSLLEKRSNGSAAPLDGVKS